MYNNSSRARMTTQKSSTRRSLMAKGLAAMVAGTLFSCVAISSAQAATLEEIKQSGKVRIAVANEIPYGYTDMSGEAKGAGPDVIRHIMKEMGVDNIEWVATNFSSLIPGLQADRFDITAAEMAVLPDRCQQIIFSEPNSSYGEGLLVAKDNPKDLHAFADFAKGDAKIAIMAGADQLEMLQKLGVPQDKMVTISSNADAISTVATGRADAYAATSLTVSELAAKSDKVQPVAEFKDPVIDGNEVRSWGAFGFNSDNTELRDAVNEALTKYKQTDAWAKALTQYGFSQADVEGSSHHTTKELCTPKS